MDMSSNPSAPITAGTPARRPPPPAHLLTLLKAGLHMSQIMPAKWATRVAARLFCTPVPSKLASRRFVPPAGVRVESLPFEQASLTLYHWPAPKDAPQLLMTHGWGGWGLQLTALAEALSAAGWAVVLIDQPAHGRSAAWCSTLPQFARALGYAAARLGRVQAVVGHSMGGAAACIAAANGLNLHKLVLISAPISMIQVTREYATAFGLREKLRANMVSYLEGREGMVFERMDAIHTAPRINAPTLVVHDREDSVVPYAAAQTLIENLPDARLLETSGLGHRRVLKDPSVIHAVTQFLGPAN